MMSRIVVVLIAGLLLAWISSTTVHAQAPEPRQFGRYRVDAHGAVGPYGLGIGGRVEWDLHRRGFIDDVSDELHVSLGFDLFFVNFEDDDHVSDFALLPLAAAQWLFGPFEDWTVFPEIGAAVSIAEEELPRTGNQPRDADARVTLHPHLGVGARLRLNRYGDLSLRLAYPSGAVVGVTF